MKDFFWTAMRFQRLEVSVDQLKEITNARAPSLLGEQVCRLGDGSATDQKNRIFILDDLALHRFGEIASRDEHAEPAAFQPSYGSSDIFAVDPGR